MFPIYPYINVNDLNLDYLLKSIKEIQTQVEYFVSLNAIKYADPIQWDITRQYEKNTIVIDPQTGTAYISVAPVPIGAQLTRPEYWTVVFDLGSFVVRASKNFSIRYEAETTTSATFNTLEGEWLVWGDTLYRANVNITAGDTYVPNGNITHITIEEYIALIGDLVNLSTVDKTSIVNAINEVVTNLQFTINRVDAIITNIGDLVNLSTVDKTSIVNAINEVVSNLQFTINRVDAIITNIGDLANLSTVDKTSIVNAINEVAQQAANTRPRKIVFMSDSYGVKPDCVDVNGNSFVDLIRSELGIGSNLIDIPTSSSGFVGDDNPVITWEVRWKQILINNAGTIGDPNEITDIVFCGGANDIKWTTAQIETAMSDCISYCKTTYPNARIEIASPGVIFEAAKMEQRAVGQLSVYRNCGKYGAEYLHNSEFILTNTSLLKSDHVHPNTDGVPALAQYLTECLLNGSCAVNYSYVITPVSTHDGGDFNCIININNNLLNVTGVANFLLYTYTGASSASQDFVLAVMPNLPFIGRGLAIPVTFRLDGTTIKHGYIYNDGDYHSGNLYLHAFCSEGPLSYSTSLEVFGSGTFINDANSMNQIPTP